MPRYGRASATFAEEPPDNGDDRPDYQGWDSEAQALDANWAVFSKIATGVALATFPVFFLALYFAAGMGLVASIVAGVIAVGAFRGLVELIARRFIPTVPLSHTAGAAERARDITRRRRIAFWRFWFRAVLWVVGLYLLFVLAVFIVQVAQNEVDLGEAFAEPWNMLGSAGGDAVAGTIVENLIFMVLLLVITVVTFFGPLMIAGIRQISVIEPGDADWGVRIADVRGQSAASRAIREFGALWQAGEKFEEAGGTRERGILMTGPPGTGKTMMAKSLATEFNVPIVMMPGPAVSQAFIGVDVIIVQWLSWRARRVSRKWEGRAIVFIDEVDALGTRRDDVADTDGGQSASIHDVSFYGNMGALNRSGDLVLETPRWRERVFAERAAHESRRSQGLIRHLVDRTRRVVAPGMNSGSLGQAGLHQLLVEMDGMRAPSTWRRVLGNRVNTFLDALFFVPSSIGRIKLRFPAARPRKEELFFIGACNVPPSSLDPALTRPGRLGYTVRFTAPDFTARKDIIDLYVNRIAHDPDVSTPQRLGELARITMGYSPAMIKQAMTLALAQAFNDGRTSASWDDVVTALTRIGWGDARELTYSDDEERAIAIHESGHAVAGHAFMEDWEASRLSILPRGPSYGHHSMSQITERHLGFGKHSFADLIWSLGAIAAERVFYDDTSKGVGGDLDQATMSAAMMVGIYGMRVPLPDVTGFASDPDVRTALHATMRSRFVDIGNAIMNRTYAASALGGSSLAAVLDDDVKREEAAVLMGYAFMRAYWLILHNKDATSRVADALVDAKELHGDQVENLLKSLSITIPDVDITDESQWPTL